MSEMITVVGAGVSGRALAVHAARHGAKVFVTDRSAELPEETQRLFRSEGIEWECGAHTERACECDTLLVSSGVGEASAAVVMAREKGVAVRGELDYIAPFLRGRLIAVTGTNGKTTTTSLIAHILQKNGINAVAAGNIGQPLAAEADKDHDAVVMELSSFQLHWNTQLKPDVAVLTNLAPDHIDWHGSYENYCADKCKIFLPPLSGGSAIVQERDAARVPKERKVIALGDGINRIGLSGEEVVLESDGVSRLLFHKNSSPLIGSHNLENAAMAAAAAVLAFPYADVEKALPSFAPPRHRTEKVCVRNGVLYVDDSKGTNVAASVTALRSIPGKKVVILGGQGKGESYELLAQTVKDTGSAAVVMGSEAPVLCEALERCGGIEFYRVHDMPEAVNKAAELAKEGETVLLSPACTSWDSYKNYKERGDHFAALARELR